MKKTISLLAALMVLAAGAVFAWDDPAVEAWEYPAEEAWDHPAEEAKDAPVFESGFERAQIRLNYWIADYTGKIKFQDIMDGTIKGQRLDLVDDLGLENPQGAPELEARVKLGQKHLVSLSWFGVDYGGEEKLSTPVEFAGYVFEVNTKLKTTYRIDRIKLTHTWSPFIADIGRLGFFWGGEYFLLTVGYKGTEETTDLGIDKKETLPLLVPVIGITGALDLPYGFGLYASYGGMGISFEDIKASFTDFEAGLSWDYKWLHLGAGYRMLNSRLDFDDDDQSINLNIDHAGWMVSLGANF